MSYQEADTCPNGYDKPDQGAKLVVLWIRSENVSDDHKELPSVSFRLLEGEREVGRNAGGITCLYDDNAWGNACWQVASGGLWPGVSCQGWEVLEVPQALDVGGLTVKAVFDYWPNGGPVIGWRPRQ